MQQTFECCAETSPNGRDTRDGKVVKSATLVHNPRQAPHSILLVPTTLSWSIEGFLFGEFYESPIDTYSVSLGLRRLVALTCRVCT